MVIPMKNSPINLLTNIIFLVKLYDSLFSFMIVLKAKQTNILLLNLKIFLLNYRFMKTQLILVIESSWTLKDLILFRHKEPLIVL